MDNEKTMLREQRLLHLFMMLNVGLAGALVVLLVLSRREPAPPPISTVVVRAPVQSPSPSPPTNGSRPTPVAPALAASNALISASLAETGSVASAASPSPTAPVPVVSGRQFTWQDLGTAEYPRYIRNLRAIGCPEDKVRQIVLADINQLFDQRRLRAAIAADIEWWRPQPEYVFTNPLREPGRLMAEQRRSLITHLLGAEALAGEEDQPAPWSHVALAGAVLGAMPMEKHARVQEICGKALERQDELLRAPLNLGQPASPIEAARSRDQTRVELREVMTQTELEEFLLRYSQIARTLRLELAPANPTADEFRKVFRAVDPIEHQMQLEFGSLQTMSQQQRERYTRQRDAAIREVLGAERFQAYLVSKDPLYQVAQATATQRNAPPEALLPIYQLIKASEARRQKIQADSTLSAEQKRQAIDAVNLEHAESIQKLVQAAARR